MRSNPGGLSVVGIDVTKEAVIQGRVLRGDDPVAGAYVRLLDSGGEFTAEVPTSATGHFRFFAGDGSWTLRTLAPGAKLDRRSSPPAAPCPRSTSTSSRRGCSPPERRRDRKLPCERRKVGAGSLDDRRTVRLRSREKL